MMEAEVEQTPYKKLQENPTENQDEGQYVGMWEMIPPKAFLFFPSGEEIKTGNKEKQWRKIFQNGQLYEEFEQQNLKILEKRLSQYKIQPHPWFNKANKLRVLQAHKFKLTDTCTSIKQGSKWRTKDFPVRMTDKLEALLKSGCAYYCGRDQQYRPLLIVDISKFKDEDEQLVPNLLMVMLEFMIDKMLIQGQVENYVLILDLEKFNMGMKSTVTKILSFTSNTYRGRLFACYLLGMPSLLKFGWDAIASKFVSENTLKKIKITKEMQNPDMWTHVDKSRVQIKFGGTMTNISQNFWPPSKKLLNDDIQKQVSTVPLPGHLTIQNYENLYQTKKLSHRKIYLPYIETLLKQRQKSQKSALKTPIKNYEQSQQLPINTANKSMHPPTTKTQTKSEEQSPIPVTQMQLNKSKIEEFIEKSIKVEKTVKINKRNFRLMFDEEKFLMISGVY